MTLGFASGEGGVGALGASIYALAPPAVHFAHGRMTGFGSFALRVLGPLVPAAAGAAIVPALSRYQAIEHFAAGALIGYGVGAIGMAILDAAVLAYEPAPPAEPARAPSSANRRAIVPMLGANADDARVGIAGTF